MKTTSSLERILKGAGWKQKGELWLANGRAFSVKEEEAPGSWDRTLAPFLAKAILSARAHAVDGSEPVAVLRVRRASPLADGRLAEFVRDVAADQSWILMDSVGRFFPHVRDMPMLRKEASERFVPQRAAPGKATPTLFTDLNQWLLKVLLAPFLDERLLHAPRDGAIRNASTLAAVADVSIPVASRFLNSLDDSGQLERRFGDLRVGRPLELLQRWRDQTSHPTRRELGVHAVRGIEFTRTFAMTAASTSKAFGQRPPLVLALHHACDVLGFGHVKGVAPVFWSTSLEADELERMGLVAAPSGTFDAVLRVPRFPESIMRALVNPKANPTTDIIQCWLDSSHYRIRGQEQADFIWRKLFVKAFEQ